MTTKRQLHALSAAARLFPGAIRSPQIIEFLSRLLRHIHGELLIVWDGLSGHRSRAVWDFVGPAGRAHTAGVSSSLCAGTEPRRISLVSLETTRTPELPSNNVSAVEPSCPSGTSPDAPAILLSDRVLPAGRFVPLVEGNGSNLRALRETLAPLALRGSWRVPLRCFTAVLFLASPRFAIGGPIDKSPVTIPITIADNLVYARGRINDSPSLSVVLDTGSSISIVTPAVAQQIGLRTSGSTQAAGIGHDSNQSLQFVENASLQLGDDHSVLRLDGQRIAILPIGYVADQVGLPTEAFFGSNVFKKFCVTVDYEHRLATFAQSCSPPGGSESIPIKILSDTAFVRAEVVAPDGSRVTGLFLLDSGTTGALVLSKKFLLAHPQITAGRTLITTLPVTAVGGKVEQKLVRIASLDVRRFHFGQIIAVVPESSAGVLANPEIAGFIGAEVLRRFTVTWDYGQERMILLPNSALHEGFEADCSGLRLTVSPPDYTTIRVQAVLPGSPGAKAGLHVGDVVTALDGKRDMQLWRVAEELKKPGASPVLSIRRDHKDFQVTLHLRRLV